MMHNRKKNIRGGLRFVREWLRPTAVFAFATGGPIVGSVIFFAWAITAKDWLASGAIEPVILLVFLGVFACGLAVLPTYAISLVSGWMLGVWAGLGLVMAALSGASMVGYELAKRLAGPGIAEAIVRHPRAGAALEAVTVASPRRTTFLVMLLRWSPVMPFAANNVGMAAVGVPRGPFLLGTLVGVLPRCTVAVVFGSKMSDLDFSRPNTPWLVAAGVVITVLTLLLIGRITREAWKRAAPARIPVQTDAPVAVTPSD